MYRGTVTHFTHVVNIAPPEDVNVNLTDSPAVGWTNNTFKVFLSFTVRPPKKAQDTLFKLLIENSHFKAIVRISFCVVTNSLFGSDF